MTESTRAAAPGAEPVRAGARGRWLPAALIPVLLALVAHANVLRNGFAGDAIPWVAANPLLHGVEHPLEIASLPYRVDVAPAHSPYRPVTSLTHALSWSTSGGAPAAYHAFDVILHALVTLLVCALLAALGAAPLGAGAGGALFALHPLHVEAIASIVGRADLLVAGFALLAVLAFLRVRSAWRIPVIALCVGLALGAKESGVVVPGLIIAVLAVRASDLGSFARALKREWALWLALIAILALYFAARHAVLGTFTGRDVAPYISTLSAPLRVSTAIANWTTYARLLFFPFLLSADYGPAVTLPAGLLSPRFWAGLLLLAGSLVLMVRARRRAPLVSLGVLWFTVAVFPVTNLVIMTPVWVAERTLYLPSVAIAMTGAALVPAVLRAGLRERRLAAATLALVLMVFGVRTWQRNQTWESSFTVATTLIEERPESFRAAWWLARMVAAEGRWERAAELFEQADNLLPGNPGVIGDYAGMLIDAGQAARAETLLRRLPAGVSADAGIFLVRALVLQRRAAEATALLDTLQQNFPRDWRLPVLAAQIDSARAAAGR